LYAVIYGTGKWARLLGSKLEANNIEPVFVGSNSAVALYTRDTVLDSGIKGCPVFIASKTVDHRNDLLHCLNLEPNAVYVEKGFSSAEERLVNTSVPVFIMSQYRFSEVFTKLNGKIVECIYDWTIDRSNISEWAYHIISIDNYIRQLHNQVYIKEAGEYTIDNVSKLTIGVGDTRKLNIKIRTETTEANIDLGRTNSIRINNEYFEYPDEDCLSKQIAKIFADETEILERL
jgi:hypothetical protein